jgi:hypothetical protein
MGKRRRRQNRKNIYGIFVGKSEGKRLLKALDRGEMIILK